MTESLKEWARSLGIAISRKSIVLALGDGKITVDELDKDDTAHASAVCEHCIRTGLTIPEWAVRGVHNYDLIRSELMLSSDALLDEIVRRVRDKSMEPNRIVEIPFVEMGKNQAHNVLMKLKEVVVALNEGDWAKLRKNASGKIPKELEKARREYRKGMGAIKPREDPIMRDLMAGVSPRRARLDKLKKSRFDAVKDIWLQQSDDIVADMYELPAELIAGLPRESKLRLLNALISRIDHLGAAMGGRYEFEYGVIRELPVEKQIKVIYMHMVGLILVRSYPEGEAVAAMSLCKLVNASANELDEVKKVYEVYSLLKETMRAVPDIEITDEMEKAFREKNLEWWVVVSDMEWDSVKAVLRELNKSRLGNGEKAIVIYRILRRNRWYTQPNRVLSLVKLFGEMDMYNRIRRCWARG